MTPNHRDAVYDDAEFDAAANTSVDANAVIDDAVADDDAYSEAADADSDSDSDAFDYVADSVASDPDAAASDALSEC